MSQSRPDHRAVAARDHPLPAVQGRADRRRCTPPVRLHGAAVAELRCDACHLAYPSRAACPSCSSTSPAAPTAETGGRRVRRGPPRRRGRPRVPRPQRHAARARRCRRPGARRTVARPGRPGSTGCVTSSPAASSSRLPVGRSPWPTSSRPPPRGAAALPGAELLVGVRCPAGSAPSTSSSPCRSPVVRPAPSPSRPRRPGAARSSSRSGPADSPLAEVVRAGARRARADRRQRRLLAHVDVGAGHARRCSPPTPWASPSVGRRDCSPSSPTCSTTCATDAPARRPSRSSTRPRCSRPRSPSRPPIVLGEGPFGDVAARRAASMFGRTGRVPVAHGCAARRGEPDRRLLRRAAGRWRVAAAAAADDIFADPFLDGPTPAAAAPHHAARHLRRAPTARLADTVVVRRRGRRRAGLARRGARRPTRCCASPTTSPSPTSPRPTSRSVRASTRRRRRTCGCCGAPAS